MSTYQTRKSRGLCVGCGKRPPEPGRVHCAACRDARLLAYRQRLDAGLCTFCGKPNPGPYGDTGATRTRCAECAHRFKVHQTRRQQRLVAARQCVICGAPLSAADGTRCAECARKFNVYQQARRARLRAAREGAA